ncbi:MAG: hypothetical protein NTY64_15080 [Deltaproteobacteria bacterium]|nr:hypothetical protein [Deltaproteobacteria bacterium]
MRIVHPKTVITVVMFLSLILLAGCPPGMVTGPGGGLQPSAGEVGRFESVQGPNVTVADRPAHVNMPIYEREEVRTGPGSTATIRFNGGGVMQLDERTDPIFSVIKGTFCILQIDIRVQGGRTIWTVLEGRIEVSSKQNPRVRVTVTAGQRTEVLRARVEPPRQMPTAELRERASRFMKIQVAPIQPRTEPPVVSPPARTLPPTMRDRVFEPGPTPSPPIR